MRLLTDFEERANEVKTCLPYTIRVSEEIAARVLEFPDLLFQVPYDHQKGFAEELISRSGGLALFHSPKVRTEYATKNDIVFLSLSTETNKVEFFKQLKEFQRLNWKIVLFGNAADFSRPIPADWFFDNSKNQTQGERFPEVNLLIDVLNAYLFVCEFTSALSRMGRFPGILKAVHCEGGKEHNLPLQKEGGWSRLGKTDQKIPAGSLGHAYLERVALALDDLRSHKVRDQIDKAAELISDYIKRGRKVAISTCTHILLGEIHKIPKTPMIPLRVLRKSKTAFADALGPNDLLIWFGYHGIDTKYEAFSVGIKKSGCKIITSYAGPEVDDQAIRAQTLLHIEQKWTLPDAEVTVPFEPGSIAPVSGIIQALLYRILERQVFLNLS